MLTTDRPKSAERMQCIHVLPFCWDVLLHGIRLATDMQARSAPCQRACTPQEQRRIMRWPGQHPIAGTSRQARGP